MNIGCLMISTLSVQWWMHDIVSVIAITTTTTTTTMTTTTTTTWFISAQNGTYRLSHKHLKRKGTRLGVRSGTRRRCSLRSEASNSRQLEVLIAAVLFMEANWP